MSLNPYYQQIYKWRNENFINLFVHRYDADQNKDKKSFKGPGVLICSIDNMPTQLPREATDFFGDLLYPHVMDILKSDANKPFEDNKVNIRLKCPLDSKVCIDNLHPFSLTF